MEILIATPLIEGVRTGNQSSAEQWRRVIHALGHEVEIVSGFEGQEVDLLVGLHAVKSADAVAAIRQQRPEASVVVVMTGTDIYPEPSETALETLRQADLLVGLQPQAGEQLPEDLREKVRVIVQASGSVPPRKKSSDPFDVCVVGHLRDVKDPMLTAAAARLLPESSKIRIRHAGAILDPKYELLVAREQQENSRYEWLGQLDESGVRELIAASQLLVITSLSEGAGRVVGSAIAKHTPVFSTRIHGVVGMLGEDYPGLFSVGDAEALAGLLSRAECEAQFLNELAVACDGLRLQYDPERELAGWRELLEEIANR